ncbi:MAG: peptidoglycan DD-metalloendopeptidase family protein [Muribaculaceae bacterium]|nr:peptidoglycan DD-metalloendopeptidase family protein [Muribaculaceae bacterium]
MRFFILWFISLFLFVPIHGSAFIDQTEKVSSTVDQTSQTKKTTPARKRKKSQPSSPQKNNSKTSSSKAQAPKTSAEAKKKQAETQNEIKLTEQQIRENEAKVSKSLSDLGKIDQEIDKTSSQIKDINANLKKIDAEVSSLESGIASNESELAKLREEYLKAVKKMRVTKKNKTSLAFIFSSKSLNQAMRRMRYLREFSSWRENHSREINAKVEALKKQKEQLAIARDEQAKSLALRKASQEKLALQHRQQESIINDLKQNGKALQSHLQRKQAEAKELGDMVSRLIAEEQRKAAEEEARRRAAEEEARRKALEEESRQKALEEQAKKEQQLLANSDQKENKNSKKSDSKASKKAESNPSAKNDTKTSTLSTDYANARKRAPRGESKSSSNSQSTPVSDSFQDMRGKLPNPSSGSFVITSRFGRQHLPDLPDVEYDNPGIDAESDPGASAKAVFKGKVSGVYLLPGYNTVVIVNHGNYYTVYGNIANPAVKNGDNVEAGTSLGTLALKDEDSSHSAIHFEVWKNREKLNPQDWLR